MEDTYDYHTGLILSGGVARGFAHIGILQALQEWGIEPGIVSSVSAGAIVGALYCEGFTAEEILDIFRNKRLFELVKVCTPRSGFLEMRGLKDSLKKNLRGKDFRHLKKPLWITVTNFNTGEVEYIEKGNLLDAVIASCSIPVVFKPQKVNENYYVDGGITNNFPVEPIAGSCKQMIGAYVNPVGKVKEPRGVFHTVIRSFQLSISSEIYEKKKRMTVFIEPKELENYGLFDVSKGMEMYEIGYKAAVEVLEKSYGKRKTA